MLLVLLVLLVHVLLALLLLLLHGCLLHKLDLSCMYSVIGVGSGYI